MRYDRQNDRQYSQGTNNDGNSYECRRLLWRQKMHGELDNVAVGQIFDDRSAAAGAGIHRAPQSGIVGYGNGQPAESIVVAGGYEDDEDYGDLIIYTGEGGNDPNTGKQIRDQEMTK